jgi:hypothetical protein
MKTQSFFNAGVLSLSVFFAGCATQQYNPGQCVGWTEHTLGIPEALELFKTQDSYFTEKNCNFAQALGMLPFAEMTEKGTLNRAYFTLWHREYTKKLGEKKALENTGLASNKDRISELQRIIETSDYWTKQVSGGVTSAQLLVMFANKTLNPNDVVLDSKNGPPRWKYEPQHPTCTGTGVKRICTVPAPANTNVLTP